MGIVIDPMLPYTSHQVSQVIWKPRLWYSSHRPLVYGAQLFTPAHTPFVFDDHSWQQI
jgi:hypothetical protein